MGTFLNAAAASLNFGIALFFCSKGESGGASFAAGFCMLNLLLAISFMVKEK